MERVIHPQSLLSFRLLADWSGKKFGVKSQFLVTAVRPHLSYIQISIDYDAGYIRKNAC